MPWSVRCTALRGARGGAPRAAGTGVAFGKVGLSRSARGKGRPDNVLRGVLPHGRPRVYHPMSGRRKTRDGPDLLAEPKSAELLSFAPLTWINGKALPAC